MAPPRRTVALLDDPVLLAGAYRISTIAELAQQVGVSAATVRRALVRHGIDRLPRNRNRRPPTAQMLDDVEWLRERYRTHTGVEIAAELGTTPRTVYAAMARHGIERRSEPGILQLRRPQLADPTWLKTAVERRSSSAVAEALGVSPGTVSTAYERVGIDPASTTQLYARGHPLLRPSPEQLRTAWHTEDSFRGVGRQLGIAPNTAAVWLAEIGIFAGTTPALSHSVLIDTIRRRWSQRRIAAEHAVSITTVRIELHRHDLFDAHRTRHR